jgi:hypothetical protein
VTDARSVSFVRSGEVLTDVCLDEVDNFNVLARCEPFDEVKDTID